MQSDKENEPLDHQLALKRRRLWIGRVGCVLGIVAGLMGLLLGRMSNLWVAFDIFAQFTVQFLLFTAAFAIGLLLPRAKVALSLAMFLAMTMAYGAWPLLHQGNLMSAQADTTNPTMKPLKVLTFNTWLENETPAEVIDEVKRVDADVVTLVEFGTNKEQLLPTLKAQYPYQFICNRTEHCHFAIISKYPLASTSAKFLWEGPPLVHAVLGGEFAGLNVFAVHSTRFPHSRAQYRQMKALSALLQETSGPKLIMGDFNATPYSRMTGLLESEVGLRRFTAVPSWPSYLGVPQLAIDHVFASEGITELQAPQLGNSSGSDHFPVRMSLAVPAAMLASH